MASCRHRLAGRGLVGGDVKTPAPTSLNEGRGEGDVGAAVLPWGRRAPRLAMTWHCSSTLSCSGGGGVRGDDVEG